MLPANESFQTPKDELIFYINRVKETLKDITKTSIVSLVFFIISIIAVFASNVLISDKIVVQIFGFAILAFDIVLIVYQAIRVVVTSMKIKKANTLLTDIANDTETIENGIKKLTTILDTL
jgi:membrane protein implicated in regulation of membrane protease activity